MKTEEDLMEIFEKAKKVAIIKGGYHEGDFRYVVIYADGSLAAVFSIGGMGYYEDEFYDIASEDLNKDVETLKKERKELEEEFKRKQELNSKSELAKKEKEEYDMYVSLKNKFDKK
jgi:hypothetical protein